MDENDAPLHDAVLEDLYGVFNRTREQWLHELLLVGNHFANDSSLIRSEVMAEIGENNPALVQLHDYDMWLKIALRHDLHVLEEPLMRYRRVTRSTSISSHSPEYVFSASARKVKRSRLPFQRTETSSLSRSTATVRVVPASLLFSSGGRSFCTAFSRFCRGIRSAWLVRETAKRISSMLMSRLSTMPHKTSGRLVLRSSRCIR